MEKRILFTGGGSAGHVTMNAALIPKFLGMGWDVQYMGSRQGIEAKLVEKLCGVDYIAISTGKLRRYLDWENVKDPFRVMKGVFQAYRHIRKWKPHVVFSKGGFVCVPVVLGAWLNRVPIVIHESDFTPGLANRISLRFASKICVTFTETKAQLKEHRAFHVGAIIREELWKGSVSRGLNLCGFTRNKPVVVCMGGSLGSQRLNEVIRRNLKTLTEKFQVVHICGAGQVDPSIKLREYRQYEYIHDELADVLAMADMVISRAGSNAIFEFLALHKPMLLVPLSKQVSRGDQILNAQSFKNRGYAEVLAEEAINDENWLSAIESVYEKRNEMIERMRASSLSGTIDKVVELIKEAAE